MRANKQTRLPLMQIDWRGSTGLAEACSANDPTVARLEESHIGLWSNEDITPSKMPAQQKAAGHVWKRPALLVVLGCSALFVGLLVYLTDRDPLRAVLIPNLTMRGGRNQFGALGHWLPSFVHALAFSSFTAAVLKPATAVRVGACAFWCALNVAFEVGQHTVFKSHWAGSRL